MKKLLAISFALILAGCAKVAFTGRTQLAAFPNGQLNAMALTEYNNFLKENPAMTSGSAVDKIRTIGNDIRMAVETYYKANELEGELANFNWEFNVVDQDVVNAFAMPGGKIVMYTGIMKVAQNDDAIAAVMGHEIAHALAHHGRERMSQQLGLGIVSTGLDAYLAYRVGTAESQEQAQQRELVRQGLMTAVGLGAQVGILLPFSREHESEADEIGLYLMTMAGYDPTQAAPFWERMSQLGDGQRPPEFLSTHPDPSKRKDRLATLVPKAREYATKYPVPGSSRYR